MAQRDRKDSGESVASSSGSSVMQYDVNVVDDEEDLALPDHDTSVVLVKRTSLSDYENANLALDNDASTSIENVTVVNIDLDGVNTEHASDSGRSSAETPEVSVSNTKVEVDPHNAMAVTGEITFDQEEVMYVPPSQPTIPTSPTTTLNQTDDSFYNPDESVNDAEEDNTETFDINDYRIAHLVKEEIVDFQFGRGRDKEVTAKDKRSEEKEPAVMSLRQVYRKPYRTAEETFQDMPSEDSVSDDDDVYQPGQDSLYSIIKKDSVDTVSIDTTQTELSIQPSDLQEQQAQQENILESQTDKAWQTIENTKPSYYSSKEEITTYTHIEREPSPIRVKSPTEKKAFSYDPTEDSGRLSPIEKKRVSLPLADAISKGDLSNETKTYSYQVEESNPSFIRERKYSHEPDSPSKELPSGRRFSYEKTNVEPNNNNKEEEKRSVSYLGPQPWGTSILRAKSEPSVQDSPQTLYNTYSSPRPVPEDDKVRKETRRFSALVGPQGFNRPRYSGLNFLPRSEGETENVLEEKSISMMALSAERKPVTPSYSSSSQDLSMANGNTQADKPSNGDGKKSLQKQYEDLQKQFTQWQQQLVENQTLLSKKKIVPKKEDAPLKDIQRKLSPSPSSPKSPNSKFAFDPKPAPAAPAPPPPIQNEYMKRTWSVETSVTKEPAAKYENAPPPTAPGILGGGPPRMFSAEELMSAKTLLRGNSTEMSIPEAPPLPVVPPPFVSPVVISGNNSFHHQDAPPREGSPGTLKRSLSNEPPAAPNPPPVIKSVAAPGRRVSSQAPAKDKSRFGPQLCPREELMIAIRNARGRETLNKVCNLVALIILSTSNKIPTRGQ